MKRSLLVVALFACVGISQSTILENGNVTLVFNITTNDGIFLELLQNDTVKLSAHIGAGISFQATRDPKLFISQKSDVQFSINEAIEGFNIFWTSPDTSTVIQDCYDLRDFDWFNGQEGAEWPAQNAVVKNAPYIVSKENAISEPYWLTSVGSFIFVNETTPLFVDQNNLVPNSLCLIAKNEAPYTGRSKVVLNYTIAANDNATEAHINAIVNNLGRPTGQPNMEMIREPIWSTSIKYQTDLSDQLLADFGDSIHGNEFRGQVQIEDGWEECHGSLAFKKLPFADVNRTITEIHNFALRVTLWIHPFVDVDCADVAQIGLENNYFVKGSDGKEITTSFWADTTSYLVDFTNEEAADWFAQRLGLLIQKHTLDGFKFAAGEASWASSGAILKGDPERLPNEITEVYSSISNFTQYVHVHSGWRTQWVPVFVSIPEKEPNWSPENGLKSVLINMFQLNLAGYTMAIPGLIGGKSLERPSPELYIRWTQAVTFMPTMQFGYLPWEIIGTSYDVLAIVKKFIDLHYWYSDGIKNIITKSRTMGLPVNPAVWWVDPTNPQAFKIVDQYMLGQNILIAPILDEGVFARDIYLPPGRWRDGNNDSTIYEGATTLKNYPAPIDVLPYFERE